MIIDGRKLAERKNKKLEKKIKQLKKRGITPKCISFTAKQDSEGKFYSQIKKTLAKKLGIIYEKKYFSFTNKKKLQKLHLEIKKASKNPSIHGIIIQKPSKSIILKNFTNIDKFRDFWVKTVKEIKSEKDVDGLNPLNLGLCFFDQAEFWPATVKAVWDILIFFYKKEANIIGKNIVILGSSEILGKPLALILRDKGATVCLCGSKTKNLNKLCQGSEIIISCVGKPGLINREMVNKSTVIIDAGTKKVKGKICGDADFKNLKDCVSAITPVPGGVGPVTVSCLLENLIKSANFLSS